MNTLMEVYTCHFYSCLFPCLALQTMENGEKRLYQLDQSLEKKKVYEHEKLENIKRLKQRLKTTPRADRFDINRQLFNEYSSYQYDSAYVYANHLLAEAHRLQNPNYEVRGTLRLSLLSVVCRTVF